MKHVRRKSGSTRQQSSGSGGHSDRSGANGKKAGPYIMRERAWQAEDLGWVRSSSEFGRSVQRERPLVLWLPALTGGQAGQAGVLRQPVLRKVPLPSGRAQGL
eukprot:356690-Chlamydomonas_euryale.AAC.16